MKDDRNRELLPVGSGRTGQRRTRVFSFTVCVWFSWLLLMAGCATVNQEQAESHMNIGVAYMQSGEYNSALKELLKAEKLGEANPKIHYLLGIAYSGKGLQELAIAEMKKAISLDNNYSEAHNFLGTIYLNMEKWDLAIESFEKALANILYDTPAKAHYNMGLAYYHKGSYAAALQQYGLASTQNPEPADLPFLEKNWGIALLASGRPHEALKHLQKSVELVPALAESYYWIGQCFVEQGNREKAKEAFQEVIRLAPDTEWGEKSRKKIRELSFRR